MAETLHCYRHPNRETRVSCAACGRPICTECMRQTAVGIKCPEDAQLPRGARAGVMKPKQILRTLLAGAGIALLGIPIVSIILGLPFQLLISAAAGYGAGTVINRAGGRNGGPWLSLSPSSPRRSRSWYGWRRTLSRATSNVHVLAAVLAASPPAWRIAGLRRPSGRREHREDRVRRRQPSAPGRRDATIRSSQRERREPTSLPPGCLGCKKGRLVEAVRRNPILRCSSTRPEGLSDLFGVLPRYWRIGVCLRCCRDTIGGTGAVLALSPPDLICKSFSRSRRLTRFLPPGSWTGWTRIFFGTGRERAPE